ncbi:LytTR family DNA-binding domain-containing protein [Pseudoduganella sp. SL102]|uniref:LytR/AlgR family response regulator transcription factor n=1 Tax=Pseudoduganella sp. SL102 TaxID=2995154 RepID=UPI00248CE421|nr:LytTR family DNA-binding domain-containing protein [Pseudoduganella sp. SL102]WBS04515.1 LytTR family DNA-binding domain-containing protein [Pseudoduganella sp. SL102]
MSQVAAPGNGSAAQVPLRVLIVDDERLARAELRRLLAAHPGIEIVGEAAHAEQAIAQVAALQPDLLLLDVQMPGASGFDLLQALDTTPEVIFTTAFDQYALQAFEVNALDYLQKPIQATRLAAALQRAALRLNLPVAGTPATPRKLFVRDGERCWFVALDSVRLFESEGNYTRVYFDDVRPLVLRSLTQLEERLDPQRFLRASRRHIVNLAFVERMSANDAGGFDLLLPGDMTVEVSRRRAAQVRSLGL